MDDVWNKKVMTKGVIIVVFLILSISFITFSENSAKERITGFALGNVNENVAKERITGFALDNVNEINGTNQTNETITYKCTDTDGGINYNIRGNTFEQRFVDGKPTTITPNETDFCRFAGQLREYYCSESNRFSTLLHMCPNGCSNGACIQNQTNQTTTTTFPTTIITTTTIQNQTNVTSAILNVATKKEFYSIGESVELTEAPTSVNVLLLNDIDQQSDVFSQMDSIRDALIEIEGEYVSGELLVKFRSDPSIRKNSGFFGFLRKVILSEPEVATNFGSVNDINKKYDIQEFEEIEQNVNKLEISDKADILRIAEEYEADPNVETAQPNYIYSLDIVPNDPLYNDQWAHQNTNAEAGWDIETGSEEIIIAIIDTGVDYNHEDLKNRMWTNPGEIPDNNIDDDNNGFVDDVQGWNFGDNSNDPFEGYGHGTATSGTAVAESNNGVGVAGVCWNCKIMNLKVSPRKTGSMTTEDSMQAVRYAAENGADVISMSFGGSEKDALFEEALNDAYNNNVVLVASAGNTFNSWEQYPGAYENVIGVAATDEQDLKTWFSQYGHWVDVSAPGINMLLPVTTEPDHSISDPSGYKYLAGTSFSGPYVAGVAGLILSQNPSLSAAEVKEIIEFSGDKTGADLIGTRINVQKALTYQGLPEIYAMLKGPDFFVEERYIENVGNADVTGIAIGDSYVVEFQSKGSSTWTEIGSGGQKINDILAVLDRALLESLETGIHKIRLTVTKGDLIDTDTIAFTTVFEKVNVDIIEIQEQPGWPQRADSDNIASTSYDDLNLDGKPEIIITQREEIIHENRLNEWIYTITVFEIDGSKLFSIGPLSTIYKTFPPAIGDVDADGFPELVAAVGQDLYVWNHDGSLSYKRELIEPGKTRAIIFSPPTLSDINNDGLLDIVFGGSSYLFAWNGDGTQIDGWPVKVNGFLGASGGYLSPVIADVNGDGNKEVFISAYNIEISYPNNTALIWNNVFAFRSDGTSISGWPRLISLESNIVIADIDNNGRSEILLPAIDSIDVRNLDGSLIKRITIPIDKEDAGTLFTRSWVNYLSVGNIDADDELEFATITVGALLNSIYLFDDDGTLMEGFPIDIARYVIEVSGEPIIADINGDENAEIIFSSSVGIRTEDHLLFIINTDGTGIATELDLVGIGNTPSVGDIDLDGDIEIIVSDKSVAHVFDLVEIYNPDKLEWPKYRYNIQNTGVYGEKFTNERPLAITNGPYEGFKNQEIQLVGEGRSLVSNEITSVSWSTTSSGCVITDQDVNGIGTSAATITANIACDSLGSKSLSLNVEDSKGFVSKGEAKVDIKISLVADVGGPYSGFINEVIKLQGIGRNNLENVDSIMWSSQSSDCIVSNQIPNGIGTPLATVVSDVICTDIGSKSLTLTVRGNNETVTETISIDVSTRSVVSIGVPSMINNTGDTDISGYLTMGVYENSNGNWINFGEVVVNHFLIVPAGGFVGLNNIWKDSGAYTTNKAGTFKVVASLNDATGNVIVAEGTVLIDESIFLVFANETITTTTTLQENQTNQTTSTTTTTIPGNETNQTTTTTPTTVPVCNYDGKCDLLTTGEHCNICDDCCIGYCGDDKCDIWGLLGTPENNITCSQDCLPEATTTSTTSTTTTTIPALVCNYDGKCDLLTTGEHCNICDDCCIGYCGDDKCDIWGLLGTPENNITCSQDCLPEATTAINVPTGSVVSEGRDIFGIIIDTISGFFS